MYGKFNFELGLTDGVKKELKDGDKLISKDGVLRIQTGENTFRGIDEKFDVEALDYIKTLKKEG